ncbi:hypothetical protein ID866_4470 [Astraeus odoratus]|nr:hypothetical protein ID866_4470 [Astraeus odoratus]
MSDENRELPATAVLGYSLDFTTQSPLDIESVIHAVKTERRVLQYYPDENTRPVTIGKSFKCGVVYNVPRCISIIHFDNSNGNYITYTTGTEASSSFQTDVSASARYLAVSASTSTSYALNKSFRREDQFAFYSFNASTYLAQMMDYIDLFNESALLRRIEQMPIPFDGYDDDNVREWKAFFASWGSHVIIKAGHGARFQLNVWASNSEESVNKKFSINVGAAFNGIMFGGSFDSSVTTEEQYKTFSAFMQKTVSVMGGDSVLNTRLAADPHHNDRFVEWAETVTANSATTNFTVQELWILMKSAASKELRDTANTVEQAFNWIVAHPQAYQTDVTLDIQSDWAEFNLLTPGAVIINVQTDDPGNTVMSETRVQWGLEYSHQYQRKTLSFRIINDGSPIDFSTSHGSNGGKPGEGKAIVLMEGANYVNDKITDNVWNTQWFYQMPVSSTPAQSRLSRSRAPHTWNEVLNDYLEEIGVKSRALTE